MWEAVREAIEQEACSLGCQVIALDGTEDHAHLLVRIPGRVSAAQLAKQMKGNASHALNRLIPIGDEFRWQEGYGAFSVSRSHVARVRAYIESQRERHARGDLWPEWEEVDEEAGP